MLSPENVDIPRQSTPNKSKPSIKATKGKEERTQRGVMFTTLETSPISSPSWLKQLKKVKALPQKQKRKQTNEAANGSEDINSPVIFKGIVTCV